MLKHERVCMCMRVCVTIILDFRYSKCCTSETIILTRSSLTYFHIQNICLTSAEGLSRGKSVKTRLAAYSTAMESIQAESDPVELDEDIP